jgi:hypothetical protein
MSSSKTMRYELRMRVAVCVSLGDMMIMLLSDVSLEVLRGVVVEIIIMQMNHPQH